MKSSEDYAKKRRRYAIGMCLFGPMMPPLGAALGLVAMDSHSRMMRAKTNERAELEHLEERVKSAERELIVSLRRRLGPSWRKRAEAEVDSGKADAALWEQVLSEAGGNQHRARSLYIRARVEVLFAEQAKRSGLELENRSAQGLGP